MADEPGLFAKTGKDSINLFGHKIPIALIGGVAALGGVLLLLRARSQGQTASVGAAPAQASSPYTAASSGFGSSFSPDYSAALADISQQLTSLSQAGINGAPTPAASAPALVTLVGQPGYRTNSAGQALLALWNGPSISSGEFSELPAGTQLATAGVPVQGQPFASSSFWQPVSVGGQTKYVFAPDTQLSQGAPIQ